MPWFRLEDSFYDHPKVMAAGNAPTGLWVRAATWSARQLTDGVIPAAVVAKYGTRREIEACTASGLWVPVDDDYLIPDWAEYQPSSLEVKEKRRREAERKREQRARGAANVDHDPAGRFQRRDDGLGR